MIQDIMSTKLQFCGHYQFVMSAFYHFMENLVVERNLGDFLFIIRTINKQNKRVFGNLAPICSVIWQIVAFHIAPDP